METVIQLTVSGLAFGAIYALVALGFVLVYNAVGVVNFALGEFVMFPAFIALTFVVDWALPWPLAYLLVLLAMVVFGLVFQRVAYYPLRNRSYLPVVISTIGASILLRNGSQQVWGAIPRRFPSLAGGSVNIGGASVSRQALLILAVTGVMLLLQYFLFERTLLGKKMRATAQDKDTARLMGINVGLMIAITFAYSAILGGVAALLLAPLFNVTTTMGALVSLKAFSASIVGGFGSVPGAIIGGLFLGVVESLAASWAPAYTDAFAFIILIAVLLFRPQGLFGERIAEKA